MDKQLLSGWITNKYKILFPNLTDTIEYIVETEQMCRRTRKYVENDVEVTTKGYIINMTIWESPEDN